MLRRIIHFQNVRSNLRRARPAAQQELQDDQLF
jgi:hypothetical protein